MIASGILTSCSNPKISRDSNLASQPDKPKSEDQNESKSEDQNPKEVNVQPYKTNSNSNLPKPPIKTNQYPEKQNSPPPKKQNLPPPKPTHTQNFTIIERKGNTRVLPVKMLWLIDNSSSMRDDIPRVQAGIKGFVDALTKNHGIDITVTFVSCIDRRKTCVKSSIASHSAITIEEQEILSTNGLMIAMKVLSRNLSSYFDSSSTNVIVSVTDDRSDMSYQDFIGFLVGAYGSTSNFRFFGYIQPEHDYRSSYHNLARILGGKIYDITSNSSTAYGTFFKDLAKGIQSSTIINTFTLERNCTGIKTIVLDGSPLGSSLYSCSGTTLNVSKGAILGGKQITVTYYYS